MAEEKTVGEALLEIEGSDGWRALKKLSDGIRDTASEELNKTEEGGERNRGKIDGLERLFSDADDEMKKAMEKETKKD